MRDDRETVKDDIEKMREELNRIVVEEADKSEVVRFSQELDDLINRYYSLGE